VTRDKRRPVVVVTRHPDYDNEYAEFGGGVETYDIDMGRSDLSDHEECAEWVESHRQSARDFRHRGYPDVADYIEEIIAEYDAEEVAR